MPGASAAPLTDGPSSNPRTLRSGHMSSDRPPIPEETKRTVRQRCGFGCVVCGMPLYHYDHMVEWSEVQEHDASNLTLLCPNHHHEKTVGLRNLAQVQAASAKPFNRQTGQTSKHLLSFVGDSCEIIMASNRFIATHGPNGIVIPFFVNGRAPISFKKGDDELLLNVGLADESGKDILRIRDNELTLSAGVWDATFIGAELTMRAAKANFIARILFKPPNRVVVKRFDCMCGDVELKISDTEMSVKYPFDHGGFVLTGNKHAPGTVDANVGLLVGPAPTGLSIGVNATRVPEMPST